MFCSIKMYFDEYPDLSNPQNILDVFDIIGDAIGEKYDLINYLLFDPDSDRILINRNYKYNDRGLNRFLKTTIEPIVIGEDGDQSSPFLAAETRHNSDELFSKISTKIIYPFGYFPFTISINYKYGSEGIMSLEKFVELTNELKKDGFIMNNSIIHVYGLRNVSMSLDGGRTGLNKIGVKKNIDNFHNHHLKGHLNSLMGVYCADSIRSECLDEATKKEIERIVGSDNVINDNGMFYFSLGKLEKMNPFYRIRYMDRIMKIKKLME